MLLKKLSATVPNTLANDVTSDQLMDAKASAFWRFEWPRIQDKVWIDRKILVFRVRITSKELKPVFEYIFGPAPAEAA